jgi:SAM-dependent methyltransferase
MRDLPMPWFPRALAALDLRPRDRVLFALPSTALAVRTVMQAIGKDGRIVVLEPQHRRAEAIARELPEAEVIATSDFDQRYGAFDAVLALPTHGPLPVPLAFAQLLQNNLRPGGRFALDLPAPGMLPALITAARAATPMAAAQIEATFAGPDAADLLAAVQACGMRRVEPLLGAQLLSLSSPLELLDLAGAAVDLTQDERLSLGDALLRGLGTTGACEALAHRTALAGSR